MFMPTRTCTRSGPYRLFIGTTGRTERDLDYGRNRKIIAFLFANCQFIARQLDGDPGEVHLQLEKFFVCLILCLKQAWNILDSMLTLELFHITFSRKTYFYMFFIKRDLQQKLRQKVSI